MKIALCAVQVPFMKGGAEYLCDNLYNEMIKRDLDIEYIKIPYKWSPPQQLINSSLIWKLLDLSESNGVRIDGVIATKFPSYLINHPNKVVWLIHQHRQAYDLAYTEYDEFLNYDKNGEIVRKRIKKIDTKHLKEAKKVFTISQNVSNRLFKYNGIRGEALYPPPPFIGKYHCKDFSNYILYPSRLDLLKRQFLVIESMQYVKSDVRLKIAGSGPQMENYKKLAKDLKVDSKIDFLGYVSENNLLDLYANAGSVIYTPIDEDLGYVTLEAFLSKKPVITCKDSGEPVAFVEDGINGLIADPKPEHIAVKIDRIFQDGLAKQMGMRGYQKVKKLNLSWDHVIKNLLGSIR
ncbi:glycosyltransferase family 4 protein [Methanocalculus sp.]|uniref:glycosyltransferase family 4 protein n=1 Tax=Methanocalculus sp. TaxID=2004547 RepID=UPI002618AE54|nr:glycosyltransferase family 4 protein [Methanocalculus sp.]MDG6249460.1 glycosyltransferase family 4 protein [Methanocalculus sp.]